MIFELFEHIPFDTPRKWFGHVQYAEGAVGQIMFQSRLILRPRPVVNASSFLFLLGLTARTYIAVGDLLQVQVAVEVQIKVLLIHDILSYL